MAGLTTRRALLKSAVAAGGAAAAGSAAFLFRKPRPISGQFVDRSADVGHAIRDGAAASANLERRRIPAVIVGGGIAGLSAAWRMKKSGFEEFALLELEESAGGNSRSGANAVSAYPWGAHYVPVPDRTIPLVAELFTELGVLRDGRWDARHVSRAPLSRLFIRGEWIPGLEPDASAPSSQAEQFRRFWDRIDYFRHGGEFTIPARRPDATAWLDSISMRSWMVAEGFHDARLRWYVDYACRDDYGCSYRQASAWAGVHYFAARPEHDLGFLTWPEGNGWIVKRLKKIVAPQLHTGCPVTRIDRQGRRLRVLTPSVVYECEAVVFAAPTFLAPYLMPWITDQLPSLGAFRYSPWYTANLTLDRPPRESGAPRSWENILYGSDGLGYVIATHQDIAAPESPTVWTYYRAMARLDPRTARLSLLDAPWETRKEEVLSDLEQAHPDLRSCVSRMDVMRIGHGMIRPEVGFLTSSERRRVAEMDGPVQFANSDLSGISIFEEAQHRGVRAADRVLCRLGFDTLGEPST